MLSDTEYQGLIKMIGRKVENSVIRKANILKVDVREYLRHSDERYCMVLPNQCLLGVNNFDSDYHNYITEYSPNNFTIENAGEFVMRECDALVKLTAFEKKDSEPFYKWGYSFSIDEDGSMKIRSLSGKISIVPQAANAIDISIEKF